MSVPRKMSEYAALYGCEIVERLTTENEMFSEVLFARVRGDKDGEQTVVCRSSYASDVDLNTLKELLQRVSGRTLAQYWTGR